MRNHPPGLPTALPARPPAQSSGGEPPLRIVVMGTGYVGLVTAVCMARFGHDVTAIDVDEAKVRRLQRGETTIHEQGLSAAMHYQTAAVRLRFGTDPAAVVPQAAIVFIAVGTPSRADGSACLQALDEAVRQLQPLLRPDAVVVLKSTVPVGTAARVRARLQATADGSANGPGGGPLGLATDGATDHPAAGPHVLNNPEFLREGSALNDFLHPDRILVGADPGSADAEALLRRAYRPLTEQGVAVLTMDCRSAELSKCAANAMLAARISFINEIAAIASATGADIERVRDGIGHDHRIGPQFLRAGLGYGGSCFAKDVAALRHTARVHSVRSDVLHAIERVNARQRLWAFDALQRDLGSTAALRGLRIAIWGLAFKPGTDDMRDAPSIALVQRLLRAGAAVRLYDPVAMPNARAVLPADTRLAWATSARSALAEADALMLVTDWPEFVAFDPQAAAGSLRLRLVCDGRNALDVADWAAAGMRVLQVGRRLTARRRTVRRDSAAPVLAALI